MLPASGLAVTQRAFAGTASSRALLKTQRTRSAGACRARAARINIQDVLVLVPTGDGSVDHLDQQAVELPGMIELKDDSTYTVGRAEPAELVIPVPTVSARHAEIRVSGGRVTVTDLGSTNGTFVEEEEVQPDVANELPLGSEVIFGDSFLAKFALEER